jgi:hypothetical protein
MSANLYFFAHTKCQICCIINFGIEARNVRKERRKSVRKKKRIKKKLAVWYYFVISILKKKAVTLILEVVDFGNMLCTSRI